MIIHIEDVKFILSLAKSNLSNYGTNSLGKLQKISDKDVFDNQKKDFDIINNDKKKNS